MVLDNAALRTAHTSLRLLQVPILKNETFETSFLPFLETSARALLGDLVCFDEASVEGELAWVLSGKIKSRGNDNNVLSRRSFRA